MKRIPNPVMLAAAAAVALAIGSLADPRGLRRLNRVRAEIAAYEERNRALSAGNAALRREIEALSGDVKALERAAREDLGLVRPNEILFNFE